MNWTMISFLIILMSLITMKKSLSSSVNTKNNKMNLTKNFWMW